MHALIAVQVAFCFVVHFAAGLFVATFDRLANQPTGFSSDRLLVVDVAARRPQTAAAWDQLAEHLRSVPGVEKVALAGWPLLGGNGWNGFIWVNGAPTEVLGYFLGVSPGWVDTMGIPWIDGRDLRAGETTPGVAIVNEAFAKQCFGGQNPVGRWFEKETGDGVTRQRFQVVGLVRNARYRNMREPITPTAYVPFQSTGAKGEVRPQGSGAFLVKVAAANPLALAATLRREVPQGHAEFRVSNVRTQTELILRHTVRERLLALLASFFAVVALLLAGIGLYGVLDYSVLQRRREIGIRMAIGAPSGDIARRVTRDVFAMVLAGAAAGLLLGVGSVRYIAALLYDVKPTDFTMLALPLIAIMTAALLAALPAVFHAIRIDPVTMLRAE